MRNFKWPSPCKDVDNARFTEVSLNILSDQVLIERVLSKTLECFPSALFPKIWNSIELELGETSAKSFERKVAKIYLDRYANYICIMWINLVFTIFFTL